MRDDFYVGYRQLPVGYGRALRVIVGCVVGVVVGSGVAIGVSQRDPGAAVWDTSMERTWEGVAVVEPFPAVLVVGEDGGVQPHLVVQIGKVGAREILEPFAGEVVTVTGFQLERAGRRIVELTSAESVAQVEGGSGFVLPVVYGVDEAVELEGEIVDGKCYLGAMKPGDGKAHKACALLCLDGGLPPMFADTRDPATADIRLLVFGDQGAVLPDVYRDLVAERVVVRGIEGMWGDVRVVRVEDVTLR